MVRRSSSSIRTPLSGAHFHETEVRKRIELIPDDMPTIADAVRWIAQLGGHASHASSGKPGAVTLRRGLEFITPVAIALELLETKGKL